SQVRRRAIRGSSLCSMDELPPKARPSCCGHCVGRQRSTYSSCEGYCIEALYLGPEASTSSPTPSNPFHHSPPSLNEDNIGRSIIRTRVFHDQNLQTCVVQEFETCVLSLASNNLKGLSVERGDEGTRNGAESKIGSECQVTD